MVTEKKKRDKTLSVVLLDERLWGQITGGGKHTVYTTLKSKGLGRRRNIVLVSKASQLSGVSGFIREINEKNYLKGLFIRPDVKTELIPKLMYESGVSTLKQTFILENPDALQRVVAAWSRSARHQLIADASVADNTLYVVSCSFKWYNVFFEELPALQRIAKANRAGFVIDEDGSYIHWPEEDIHLDIDTLEYHTDEEYRKEADVKKVQYHKQAGSTLKKIREEAGLHQNHITGLSARQVRRIENGEAPLTVRSLEKIAAALGMEVNRLLHSIAARQ